MQEASYYREQAARAHRLAAAQTLGDLRAILERVARDYADMAEDLEIGAIEFRHPELMPQTRR